MQWRNTSSRYGVFSLFLHWGSALVVFGLFGLGLWMRELSYYDPWYHPAPALHKSIGILLAIALLVRIVWRFVSPPPPAPANHGPLTRVASKLGHLALYGLLLAVIVAGYRRRRTDQRVRLVLRAGNPQRAARPGRRRG